MTEIELIDLIVSRLGEVGRNAQMQIGPGDDAAVMNWAAKEDLVVSTDSCVEGVHFPEGCRGDLVGYRAIATSASDIIAMGATPRYLTVALTIPKRDPNWVGKFADGVRYACESANITVAGGNLAAGDKQITTTVMGSVSPGKAVRRNTAQVGDDIWHTGKLGATVLALQSYPARERRHFPTLLRKCDTDPLARYYLPPMRNALVPCIAECASACTDITDGLELELNELIRGSANGFYIDIYKIQPWDGAPLLQIFQWDDSYELLFTAPTNARPIILNHAQATDISITRIGSITDSREAVYGAPGTDINLAELISHL